MMKINLTKLRLIDYNRRIQQEIARIVHNWAYKRDVVFLPVDSDGEAIDELTERLFNWFKERR